MNPAPAVADRPARVLIVDDEPYNRELLVAMLTPEGYVLPTAASGEEALAMVAREPPDLILLDIVMPGIDGYYVVAKIKGNPETKHIPVIMVTVLHDRASTMLALNAGAEDLLTKPVDRVEVCMRVRNLLRLKAYGAAGRRFDPTGRTARAGTRCDFGARHAEPDRLLESWSRSPVRLAQ
jgi:DNA-binding response OmpR family regulator